jgi:synaptobrevin family protein YKT6
MVAQQILSRLLDDFLTKHPIATYSTIKEDNKIPFPELKDYIVRYQNPENADSIMKIQKELDETKVVLHKTIESVLDRGEKIDKLVADSDKLAYSSKAFFDKAKKQNSCWYVAPPLCNVVERMS